MKSRLKIVAVVAFLVICYSPTAAAQTPSDESGFAQLYRSGQSAMAAGRYDEALGDFERFDKMDAIVSSRSVLEVEPRRVNIHYRIARTYLAQWALSQAAEDLATAEKEFAEELEGNPGNANAAFELAGLRRKQSDNSAAQRLYESALQYNPDFEEAEVGLGGVLLNEQKPTLAVGHLQRATALRADDEVAWYRPARAERKIGDVQAQKQALATFQKLHDRSESARNKAAVTQPQDGVSPQALGLETQPQ